MTSMCQASGSYSKYSINTFIPNSTLQKIFKTFLQWCCINVHLYVIASENYNILLQVLFKTKIQCTEDDFYNKIRYGDFCNHSFIYSHVSYK